MTQSLRAPLPTNRAVVTGTKKPFRYIRLTNAPENVISIDLVKARLLIDPLDTEFDELIELLIEGVTRFAENYTGLTFIDQIFVTNRDFFALDFELRRAPIQVIQAVRYIDIDDVQQTVDNTIYSLTESIYQRLFLLPDESWPDDKKEIPDAIEITFVAGFGTSEIDVPFDIRMALLAHVVSVFAKAGDCCDEGLIPSTALNTYKQHRIMSLKIGHSGI